METGTSEIIQSVILIGIGLQINDIRKIQNSVQEILKKVIFPIPAEAEFDNQSLISVAEETHHIAAAIGVIDTLENHLILRNILCIGQQMLNTPNGTRGNR